MDLRLLLRLILLRLLLRVQFCCDFCCEFKFVATFAASFAATFLPFVLRAQVLYHVIKMAELEKEDNIMCFLLPASAYLELYRNN